MAEQNLEIALKLQQAFANINKLLEEQAKLNQNNVSILQKMVDSINRTNFKGQLQQFEQIKEAQQEATKSVQQFGSESSTASQKVIEKLKEAGIENTKFGEGITKTTSVIAKLGFVGASAMEGFTRGLKFTISLIGNTISLASGLVGRLLDVGKSILAIPFKILTGLINDASSGGGDNSLQQALEDIRKEFGQLRETAGKAIIDIARGMKGELANTGLSVNRVFGTLAERLKTVAEYAKALGPLFEVLARNIVKNAERFAAYNKGLGLTEDGIRAVGTRAYALGQDVTEVQRQLANYSVQLGSAFGLSAKMISRDVGTMMADFKNFGSLSIREMSQLAVYTRRLGVELKAILGVVDRFDNFEDAARGAAQLSQAFGLNLDAIALLKAQNPAERIEMLRKSFFAAGRSIETMTRQERRLLAQQTGLDDSALDLTFSLRNQSLSYADVQRKGAQAQKRQLSQAEAMQKLAGAIERLVRSGSSGAGGFFDRFVQGFSVGIKRSTEYRTLMINLRRDLLATFYAGIRVGRDFVKAFPGVKAVLGNLAALFEPRRWKAMLNRVVGAFQEFFKNMTTNPQVALPQLLERLKSGFFDWLSPNGEKGRNILDGIKRFFIAFLGIAKGILKLAIPEITKGIRFITNILKNGLNFNSGEAQTKGQKLFIDFIKGAKKFFVDVGGPELWKSIKDLFGVIIEKGKGWLREHGPRLLLALFAPSIISAGVRGGIAGIASSLGSSLVSSITGSLGNSGSGIASTIGSSLLRFLPITLAALGIGYIISQYVADPVATEKKMNEILKVIQDKLNIVSQQIGKWLSNPENQKRIKDAIGALLTFSVNFYQKIFMGLGAGIKAALIGIFPEAKGLIEGLSSVYSFAYENLFGFVKSLLKGVMLIWQGIFWVFGRVSNVVSTGIEWVATFTQRTQTGFTIFGEHLSSMATSIGNFFTSVLNFIRHPITSSLEFIKTAFETTFGVARNAIQSVSGVVDRIFGNSVHDTIARDLNQVRPVANQFSNTLISASERAEAGMVSSSAMAIRTIKDNFKDAQRTMNTSIINNPQTRQANTENRTISVPVSQIEPNVATLNTSIQSLRTLNEQLGLLAQQNTIQAIPVITQMIEGINNISQQLNQIRPINISADLQRLAHNVGLGQNNEFTITHRNFNIDLNVSVRIDSGDLETVLLERPQARILSRGRQV